MDIASQMEIEILHGDDLAIAAARRAAFDSEGRPLARLANAGKYFLTEVRAERLAEPNRCRGFSLAQGRGRDGGHHDVITVRSVFQTIHDREVHLRFGTPVQFQFIWKDACLGCDFINREGCGGLRDFEIGLHCGEEGSFAGETNTLGSCMTRKFTERARQQTRCASSWIIRASGMREPSVMVIFG